MREYRYRATWHRHSSDHVRVELWEIIRSTECTLWMQLIGAATVTAGEARDACEGWTPHWMPAWAEVRMVRRHTRTVRPNVLAALRDLERRTWAAHGIRQEAARIARERCDRLGIDLSREDGR